MNRRDVLVMEYVVAGLLKDMHKTSGFGKGYHAGVRQMQLAARLLNAGGAITPDNIVRECLKLGDARPKRTGSLKRDYEAFTASLPTNKDTVDGRE